MTPHRAFTDRLCRILLRLYPRAFRARFGDEMMIELIRYWGLGMRILDEGFALSQLAP
jgi:hypothetical protein